MELFSFPPYHVELTKGLLRVNVGEIAGTYDENAHRFGVKLFRDGAEENISGCTVSGYFIRPNGYTLTLHGTVENGVAWVTLNENCYYYDGAFTLAVKVTNVGIGTVLVVDGRIIQTRTDSIVDAENKIPSLEEIYASIDKTEQAIANANTAATNANAAATKANVAASRAPYIGENGHWYIWNEQSGKYIDSTNPSMPNPTYEVRTGEAGTDVQISQGGTPEAPVIILTIPRGIPGEGSVSTVCGRQPDEEGNVELTAEDVGAVFKENLLDNSYFLNNLMINSRKVVSPISTQGMLFDRWRINAGTWAWDTNGLMMTASGNIQQRLTNRRIMANTDHTLVIYYTDGGKGIVNYYSLPVGASGDYYYINIIPELNRHIAAFGLFSGTYTAVNAPDYVYKGHDAESYYCRVCRRIIPVLFGADIKSDGREIIRLDPPMRVNPSVEGVVDVSGSNDAAINVRVLRDSYIDVEYTGWGTGWIVLNAEP